MRIISACLLLCFPFATALSQAPTPASTATQQASASSSAPKAGIPAVHTKITLQTSVDSAGSKPGKAIKATLQQAVKLPDGEMLPKGTVLTGTVLEASKHSKEKPNGVVVLELNEALVKGGEPFPVMVRVEHLAPAEDKEGGRVTLPNSNGNMVATSANSGGTMQAEAMHGSPTQEVGRQMQQSDIAGVYLSPTKQGSGAVFALNENVYLDQGCQLTVLLAKPATPAK